MTDKYSPMKTGDSILLVVLVIGSGFVANAFFYDWKVNDVYTSCFKDAGLQPMKWSNEEVKAHNQVVRACSEKARINVKDAPFPYDIREIDGKPRYIQGI